MDAELPASVTGLSSAEVAARQRAVGRNEMPSADRRTLLQHIGGVLREPMLLLLLVATAIYIAFGDALEAGALGVSVLAIVAITLAQERRTERALDALRELASPIARVYRDGRWQEVDARELVPADVIHLSEGDRIPADALLRAGTPLAVDESLLTGESVPVLHRPDPAVRALGRPGEEGASVFSGTLVGSGNAVAEVMLTGPRTEVGKIGAALGGIELARAPLHREVATIVTRVAIVAIGLCVLLAAIYIVTGAGILEALLAGITLAMSVLPEELPLVLTIFLTLGAWRIAKHHVLARRAAVIETLGAVTVLCVDKTGTLTQNQMAIRRVMSLEGSANIAVDATKLPESVHEAIEFGALACPQQPVDPMDRAFVRLADQALAKTEHVHPAWRWVREYPLSPGLLAVTHVWRDDEQRTVVATKGAPEAIIDLCHLGPEQAAYWRAQADLMAREGLRVLGVARAYHTHGGAKTPTQPHDFAFELVGLVGLADPLRPETKQMIEQCHEAGVRIVMITGDHPTTARAIARAAGLDAGSVLTGPDLEQLDEEALAYALEHTEVIARAAPAHKLRIIHALRLAGEVVGMTGDGVNDAPALKAADVGIAMGHGTEVAREASGLVILDDTLAAIAAAIRAGRTIYDNLRKVASYLLSVHVPIVGVALLPPLLGWPPLIGPIHVVLLELVIDPTCSIVFELDPPARDVMQRKPRARTEHLFDAKRVGFALLLGVAAALGPLAVAAVAHNAGYAADTVRALAFVALIAADLMLVAASRERLARGSHVGKNPAIFWMLVAVTGVFALTLVIPGLRTLFGFAPLGMPHVVAAALAGALPVALTSLLHAARPGEGRTTRAGHAASQA
ncbi:MAG TPA: cation-translocating P-type ATPase [Kofleriaceae bacterium]|nr:cation-translocating P-type ATPase [Kofleriaceae bacterium]